MSWMFHPMLGNCTMFGKSTVCTMYYCTFFGMRLNDGVSKTVVTVAEHWISAEERTEHR